MTTNRLRPFVVTLLLAFATSLSAAESKPNVLFIISDDLNNALSGFGHPECKTPNLDALAKTGTSFTRAFCQYPICGPSRASIMTGQYPEKNGVTRNGGKVEPDRITLPRHFKNNGYWTARVSKIYHMGIPSDAMQGTNGTDHPESWTERYNVRALETLTPGKLEELRMPELTKLYPQARKEWLAARDAGKPYVMPKTLRGDYAIGQLDWLRPRHPEPAQYPPDC